MSNFRSLVQVGKKAGEVVGRAPGNLTVTQPVTMAADIVTAWRDYKTICEQEKTARQVIAANRDVRLKAIQEQANIFKDLIRQTFGERAKNFDHYFSVLNKAIDEKNDKVIDTALTLIVEQTRISPMAQVAELMNSINDPSVNQIEI